MYIQFQPFFVFRPRQCDKVIEQGLNHVATVNTDLTQSTTFEWQENDVVPLTRRWSCRVPSVPRKSLACCVAVLYPAQLPQPDIWPKLYWSTAVIG